MSNASYVSLTRQSGLQKELDIIAANLANMNTHGYRREGAVFSEYIQNTDDALGSLSMTAARARYVDLSPGALERTGAPLDLAITGDAFFQVQGADGPRLTRAGSFTLNPDFQLVTLEGLPVLDVGGAPVQLPAGDGQISIAADGVISVEGQVVGQIGLVTVATPTAIRREAGTLHVAEEPPIPAEDATLSQGFLETSNVDPVTEITRMISVQRAYELAQGLVDRQDQLKGSAISTIGRVR